MAQRTYRIGEAATKLHLKSYVLRFWETEFPQIAPIRTEKGQRLYTESDLAVLARIRYLLHERGLTIDGARRLLREEAAKGILYTDAAIPADETLEDELLEDAPDPMNDDARSAGEGNLSGNAVGSAPEQGGSASVQASLFPAAGTGRSHTIAPAVPANELRAIIAELAAIRRLLCAGIPGERQ